MPQNIWLPQSGVVSSSKYAVSGPLDHIQKFSKISVRRWLRVVACAHGAEILRCISTQNTWIPCYSVVFGSMYAISGPLDHIRKFRKCRSSSDPKSGFLAWPGISKCRISPKNAWIPNPDAVSGSTYVISGPLDHIQQFSKISVPRRIRKVACGPGREFSNVVYCLRMR